MSVEQAASADTALVASPVKRGETRMLGPIAVGLALLSAFVTFIVLADFTPILPTHNVVVTLLLVNATAVLLLLGVIVREVWQVVQARRTGRAAARLHVRIVGLFSIIAAAPAILVAIVASVTLDRGLDRLFSTRTRAAIENSLIVAEAYLRDHAQIVRSDIIVMAGEIARSRPTFEQDHDKLQQYLTFQASVRGLAAAIVIDKDLKEIARADVKINQTFAMPPRDALPKIGENEPQLVLLPDTNYVAAVLKLHDFDDDYLYVTRLLDPRVVPQLQATRESVTEYAAIEARRYGVQIAFALMYTVIALTVLLSAVWIGLNFANRLVAPIRRLIGAANVVSTGNLHVRVPIRPSEGDLAQLGETFNRMTQELRSQRDDIMHARDLIDSRRRFTEAVLAGASAGVIGVDGDGCVSILNRSAEKLIGRSEPEALARPLTEVFPELADFMAAARTGARTQDQVTITRNGRERNLSVRFTSEQSGESAQGYVVTIDDITELVAAQRTSAWADVARRIAHEIKNPLTPIQLSAERIRRKYGKMIGEDRAGIRSVHRHHRAAGRRHPAHGRRVLALRAHAQARDRRRRRGRHRAPGRVHDARRQFGNRHRCRYRRGSDAGPLRPAADVAGAHQPHQERDRSDCRGAAGRARQGLDPRFRRARRRRHRHRRRRQRHRPAEGKPQPVARALCHDAREGHRTGPGHRRPHRRGSWRQHRTARRRRQNSRPKGRLGARALRRRRARGSIRA